MKFAINIINFGDCGDALTLAELARTAEEVGWDGFFVWDHIAWDGRIMPMVDPGVALTAIPIEFALALWSRRYLVVGLGSLHVKQFRLIIYRLAG